MIIEVVTIVGSLVLMHRPARHLLGGWHPFFQELDASTPPLVRPKETGEEEGEDAEASHPLGHTFLLEDAASTLLHRY